MSGRQQAARLRSATADQPGGQRLAALLPFTSVAFVVVAPVAVSVYLLSTTTWTVVERALLTRLP